MLEWLITGPPRSGTTYMATVLHAAGYDFGAGSDVSPANIGVGGRQGQGMEDRRLHLFNNSLATKLANGQSIAQVADENRKQLAYLLADLPPFAKDTQYLWTFPVWHWDVGGPNIILMQRNAVALARSLRHHAIRLDPIDAIRQSIALVEHYGNPDFVRVVDFPRCAVDERYWEQVMGDLAPFSIASQTFRRDWVRF
jgi:hypothetical protein